MYFKVLLVFYCALKLALVTCFIKEDVVCTGTNTNIKTNEIVSDDSQFKYYGKLT